MTTYLGKSCSFGLPQVSFVNCRQFMYLVISLLVLRAGCGIWLYQFLIIAYLFTLQQMTEVTRGFCWHQNFVPCGCLPLTCGYIHLLNHEKMCILVKSEVEEILFKLATNDHSDELSCWHQNFGPNGLSAPAQGLCLNYFSSKEPRARVVRMKSRFKTPRLPPVIYYWPFKGGASAVVYWNCHCSSAFYLSWTFSSVCLG